MFYEHTQKYHLVFADGEEFAHRLEIFANKDDEITSHNELFQAGKSTYELGHNEYSHLTWEEFQTRFNLGKAMDVTKRGTGPEHTATSGLPGALHVDWTAQGKVRNALQLLPPLPGPAVCQTLPHGSSC